MIKRLNCFFLMFYIQNDYKFERYLNAVWLKIHNILSRHRQKCFDDNMNMNWIIKEN